MNKLNGGYIMIDGSSSTLQADLKKAYETGRPVLYYENGKSVYGAIQKKDNTYLFVSSVLYHRVFDAVNTEDGYNVRFNILTSFDGEITKDNLKNVILNSIIKQDYSVDEIATNSKDVISKFVDDDSVYYLYVDNNVVKQNQFDWIDLIVDDLTITEY